MAIDGIGQASMQQLLAMSMVGNGQLTSSDSTSSTSNETNLAFAMVMQNLLESKNSEAANVLGQDGAVKNLIDRVSQATSEGTNLKSLAMVLNNYYTAQNVGKSSLTGISNSGSISSATQNSDYMNKIYKAVDEASSKYGVDKNLILAVIKQESDFDSSVTSSTGAQGLMQIMPSNFSYLGILNGYDINENINGGTKLLKEYIDKYDGNVEMGLMAYNGGPGTIQKRGVSSSDDLYKMPKETQNYVPSVLGYYSNGV